MLNSDDLYGLASKQLFTAQSKPPMMPESQYAHSVQAKQIQYVTRPAKIRHVG